MEGVFVTPRTGYKEQDETEGKRETMRDLDAKIETELLDAESKLYKADFINKNVDTIISLIILIALLVVGSALFDLFKFARQGSQYKYTDFDELAKINPDICAWIQMDGTHIDNPVVKGKDNFEYLDKGFDGRQYAGGTLFLDYRNAKDFSDSYCIIHGHNMEGGAMFGDLNKYEDKQFFNRYKKGKLLTPTWDYDLVVIGVAEIDAYNDKVYYPFYEGGIKIPLAEMKANAINMRTVKMGNDKLLALSTCTGAMDTTRTVVFCRMRKAGRH